MREMPPRIFVEIEVADSVGVAPSDWDMPEDITAQQVIDGMKADSSGRIERCIERWNLMQWPVIRVEVRGPHGNSMAEWIGGA